MRVRPADASAGYSSSIGAPGSSDAFRKHVGQARAFTAEPPNHGDNGPNLACGACPPVGSRSSLDCGKVSSDRTVTLRIDVSVIRVLSLTHSLTHSLPLCCRLVAISIARSLARWEVSLSLLLSPRAFDPKMMRLCLHDIRVISWRRWRWRGGGRRDGAPYAGPVARRAKLRECPDSEPSTGSRILQVSLRAVDADSDRDRDIDASTSLSLHVHRWVMGAVDTDRDGHGYRRVHIRFHLDADKHVSGVDDIGQTIAPPRGALIRVLLPSVP